MTANKLYTVGILGYFVTLIGLMSMVVYILVECSFANKDVMQY